MKYYLKAIREILLILFVTLAMIGLVSLPLILWPITRWFFFGLTVLMFFSLMVAELRDLAREYRWQDRNRE